MPPTYSTYEAKAKFSEVLRRVREGTVVTITYRGNPVAELRPLAPGKPSFEERFRDLLDRGVVTPADDPARPMVPGEHRVPGALEDFLAHRHRDR